MPNRGIPAFVFSQKQSHTFLICGAFHAKGHFGKGISGISGMGIKQEIKKGMPISPLIFMQLTQPLQSLYFTKDWRYRFEVTQKALKSKSIKKGAPLSPNLC